MTYPGQNFTLTTAAEACRVSRKTVTRRLDQLQEGGAYKNDSGAWVIPLQALLHAGLSPGRPSSPDAGNSGRQDTPGSNGGVPGGVSPRESELLRRAEVAEALASERADRITDLAGQISDLRHVLKMLEAAPSATQTVEPAPIAMSTPAPPPPPPRRRGLLGRVVDGLGL